MESPTQTPTPTQKNDALFRGRQIEVSYETGDQETVRVQQIRLTDYERAFAVVSDELALTALACGRDKSWALKLAPESYEVVQAAVKEVNARGFFAFAARQAKRLQEEQERTMAMMSAMPPETLKLAAEIGAKTTGRISPMPSPRSLPRPG